MFAAAFVAFALSAGSLQDVAATATARQPDQASGQVKLVAVDLDRAIAEFSDVCLRPMLNESAMAAAVGRSDFRYGPDDVSDPRYPHSHRWTSAHAALALEKWGDKLTQAQCDISMGTRKQHTASEAMALLQIQVERILGHPVTATVADDSAKLTWSSKDSRFKFCIWQDGSATTLQQLARIIFDRRSREERWSCD